MSRQVSARRVRGRRSILVLTAFVTSRHEFPGWPKNAEMKAAELNRRFNSGPSSLRDPLFGRPSDNRFDNLRDQEKHDRPAEVLAHGFHVAALKFYGGHAHKNNPQQIKDVESVMR